MLITPEKKLGSRKARNERIFMPMKRPVVLKLTYVRMAGLHSGTEPGAWLRFISKRAAPSPAFIRGGFFLSDCGALELQSAIGTTLQARCASLDSEELGSCADLIPTKQSSDIRDIGIGPRLMRRRDPAAKNVFCECGFVKDFEEYYLPLRKQRLPSAISRIPFAPP
jgi:hypothetical protein